MALFGIKVIILGPGAVKSGIWNKIKVSDDRFEGTAYSTAFDKFQCMLQKAERDGATPEAAGQFVRTIFEAPKPESTVRFHTVKFQNWTSPTMLPHPWLDVMVNRMLGLRKPRTSIVPTK